MGIQHYAGVRSADVQAIRTFRTKSYRKNVGGVHPEQGTSQKYIKAAARKHIPDSVSKLPGRNDPTILRIWSN